MSFTTFSRPTTQDHKRGAKKDPPTTAFSRAFGIDKVRASDVASALGGSAMKMAKGSRDFGPVVKAGVMQGVASVLGRSVTAASNGFVPDAVAVGMVGAGMSMYQGRKARPLEAGAQAVITDQIAQMAANGMADGDATWW